MPLSEHWECRPANIERALHRQVSRLTYGKLAARHARKAGKRNDRSRARDVSRRMSGAIMGGQNGGARTATAASDEAEASKTAGRGNLARSCAQDRRADQNDDVPQRSRFVRVDDDHDQNGRTACGFGAANCIKRRRHPVCSSLQRNPLRMKNGRKSSMTFTEGSAFLRTIAPYQQVTSNDASFGGSCVVDVPPSI